MTPRLVQRVHTLGLVRNEITDTEVVTDSDAARLEAVVEAAKSFAKRVDELSPKIDGAIMFLDNHGFRWSADDNWKAEREVFDATLKTLTEGRG